MGVIIRLIRVDVMEKVTLEQKLVGYKNHVNIPNNSQRWECAWDSQGIMRNPVYLE